MKPSRVRHWLWVAGLIGVLIVIVAGVLYFPMRSGVQSRMPQYGPVVILMPVQEKPMPLTLSALGSVIAPQSVTVRPQVAGVIRSVHFHPGEQVRAHQILFVLDQQSEAAALAQQEAALANSQSLLARYQALQKTDPHAISAAQMELYQSQLSQQKALVAGAQEALNDTVIRAPFSGIVSAVASSNNTALAANDSATQIGVGSDVNPGDALVDLVGLDSLEVIYSVPQEHSAEVQVGQAVQVLIPGRATPVSGTVSYISPTINPLTRTLTVHARLVGQSTLGLKPGAFVKIIQILDPHRVVLAIPSIAIEAQMEGFGVFEVRDHKAVFVPVTLGDRSGSWIAVRSGLSQGDQIVVVGQDQLSEGMLVSVSQASTQKATQESVSS